MGSVPFALSVHHFISSVGSDAGFAAIIGLAILILLYFAQARETASLRNHAVEAAERIQQLEARVAQLGRAPAPAQLVAQGAPMVSRSAANGPGASPPPGIAPPVPVGAGRIPAAPAGVGAPALTAATKLIPTPEVGSVAVAEPVAAGAATVAPGPSTVAAGGNGVGHGVMMPPPPPSGTVPPRTQLRQQGTIPPSRRPPASGGRPPQRGGKPSRGRRLLAAAVALVGVAAVVVVLLLVTNNSNNNSSGTTASQASNAPRRHRQATTFNTSQVTVAVLNGTATANLAHDIGQKLVGAGYQEGTIATATDQTHSTTIVSYLPNFKRDALAVAGTLKLKPTAVQPVDASTQAVACPPPSACKANVVVTVGSDLVTTQ